MPKKTFIVELEGRDTAEQLQSDLAFLGHSATVRLARVQEQSDTPLDYRHNLGLPSYIIHRLHRAGITTIEQLREKARLEEIISIRGIGEKSLAAINEALEKGEKP